MFKLSRKRANDCRPIIIDAQLQFGHWENYVRSGGFKESGSNRSAMQRRRRRRLRHSLLDYRTSPPAYGAPRRLGQIGVQTSHVD